MEKENSIGCLRSAIEKPPDAAGAVPRLGVMPGTADWRRPSDAQLTVFADRLEVHSPRALLNGVTVEKAKDGLRVPRNSNIVNVLRDYDFMEHRAMGIRRKVIP